MGALEIPRRSTRATPARQEPLGPRRAVASEGSVHARGGFLTCQQGRILNPDGGACGFSLRWRSLSRAAAASLVVSWAHPRVGRGGLSGSQVPRPQRPLLARARRYLRETAGRMERAGVCAASFIQDEANLRKRHEAEGAVPVVQTLLPAILLEGRLVGSVVVPQLEKGRRPRSWPRGGWAAALSAGPRAPF